ncbi:MAG: sugar phosphate isomerase/epimerase [Verrucomicrobiae bacterium]|nr:sugar phosphate isomerase/epimerase [Verrucomicrobiae bacterium]
MNRLVRPRCSVTVSLVPEARGGPFIFHGDLDVACARAAELGFHAIELFPPGADALDARLLRQVLHRNRLALAAVGTGAGWVTQGLSLTDPDPAQRTRAQAYVASIVDFAGAFGAPAILGSMQGRALGEVTRGQALEWLAQALEQLAPRAHAHGQPFLLEPLNRYESNLLNTVEQALTFLATLHSRNVRILADLFHMNIEETSIPAALERAGEILGHVHFADSNRTAVGGGHTAMAPIIEALRAVGYRGYLSAEVFPLPSPEEAARQTIESFRRWFVASG